MTEDGFAVDESGRERNAVSAPWTRFAGLSVPTPVRVLAVSAAAIVVGSYVGVLYHIVDVISNPDVLLAIVAVSLVGATLLAQVLSLRQGIAIAAVLLIGGLGWYLTQLGSTALWLPAHVRYTVALLTGRSVLGIVNLESWVLAVTPAPVFLTWYLAIQRRYVSSALVGGGGTLFFVLTGDATGELTLLGVVGVVGLVGVGELDRLGGTVADIDGVASVVALTIVLSAVVTVVPAGTGYTFSPETGLEGTAGTAGGDDATLEANLLNVDRELSIQGSIELSSKVRYRVQSTDEEYWRVAAFDVYTGDGWQRRGDTGSLDRRLGTPPDRSRTVEQTYRPLTELTSMPAAWRPAAVTGPAASAARVTRLGGLSSTRTLGPGDTYHVRSAVPVATMAELRGVDNGSAEYPESITDRFLQLPDSTPDRVATRTDRLTANANNSYDTARVIEEWLESNREYSLNVSKPSGSTADSFLFEMERGYCTYYATTMATMLRTQGIPSRMVVGYSPGQRVSEDEWVVRGHDAHAWVEVYFPDVGWVRFDPTPAGPRETAEQSDLAQAREANVSEVDTNNTQSGEWTPTSTATESADGAVTPTGTPPGPYPGIVTPQPGSGDSVDIGSVTLGPGRATPTPAGSGGGDAGPGDGSPVRLPTPEQTTLGVIALLGVTALARRSGVTERGYRALWLRVQPRTDPETDVEGAFDRLLYLLERRHRERRPGETVRAYLDAIDADERARRVAAIRERARYAGDVDAEAAEEALSLIEELRST